LYVCNQVRASGIQSPAFITVTKHTKTQYVRTDQSLINTDGC
jgi:hypothetical protein